MNQPKHCVSILLPTTCKREKMETKEPNFKASSTAKTNRRGFIKGGAAIAGAALVGGVLKASPAAATTQTESKGTTPLQDVVARPDLWFYPGEEVAPDEIRVTLTPIFALVLTVITI